MIPWLTPGVSPCGAPSGRLSTAKIVLRPRVCGYWQLDNRIASIKVRTGSGRLTLCTVYAPHNERPTDEKFDFFTIACNATWVHSQGMVPVWCSVAGMPDSATDVPVKRASWASIRSGARW